MNTIDSCPSKEKRDEAALQAQDFMNFLRESPTSYHGAKAVARRLENAGFTEVSAQDQFLGSGGQYLRQGGAVIAWIMPEEKVSPELCAQAASFQIVGGHTDSPALQVKPQPDFVKHGWGQFGVEIYGGTLFNSWLDRDLILAGRLLDYNAVEHLVQTPALARVNQLAPHLDRSVNTQGLKIDPQEHLQPLWYAHELHNKDLSLLAYLGAQVGLKEQDIAGFDLFAVDGQGPSLLGASSEFLSASRLDNLSSVFTALLAFLDNAKGTNVNQTVQNKTQAERTADQSSPSAAHHPQNYKSERGIQIPVLALFDHEEIGSATATGAAGPLLEHTLQRLSAAMGLSPADHLRVLSRSWMVSADAGHLINPNYSEKHDPRVQPQPGKGPLLKINANQRYTTNGQGQALFARVCKHAGVPFQNFVSNNSVPCGSTIGPITATRLGIKVLDVGVGLLSMHSVRELCTVIDLYYLRCALASFYGGYYGQGLG